MQPSGDATSSFSNVRLPSGVFAELDPPFRVVQHIRFSKRDAEIGDAHQRGPPVGDAADVVDEPAQRGMHLVEGADRHHQPAEADIAGEIDRRGDEDRRHDGDPAIGIGNPGQVDLGGVDAPHGAQHRAEVELEPSLRVGLAMAQRDGIDILVDAHHRGAQLCLARVAIAVEADQRASDQPAQP